MKKRRLIFYTALLTVVVALLLFTYQLSDKKRDTSQLDTFVQESNMATSQAQIDKGVITSSVASGTLALLDKTRSDGVTSDSQGSSGVNITQGVTTDNTYSLRTEQIGQEQKNIFLKRQTLNVLGEVIRAGYALTNDNQADFNAYFAQEQTPESVELYRQYVRFSANYLNTLDVEVYASEKTRMQNAFQALADSMDALSKEQTDEQRAESLQDYLNAANMLNGVIVDLGKEVAAGDISFTPNEPGYVFVFTL